MALVVGLPILWFAKVASSIEELHCTTPSRAMAQAINGRMYDHRTRVDHVRVVFAHDDRYENLFFESAEVRVVGVRVGTGVWASSMADFGGGHFRGWKHARYASLLPVNDLARTVSSRWGALSPPGMTHAAKFAQHCNDGHARA